MFTKFVNTGNVHYIKLSKVVHVKTYTETSGPEMYRFRIVITIEGAGSVTFYYEKEQLAKSDLDTILGEAKETII